MKLKCFTHCIVICACRNSIEWVDQSCLFRRRGCELNFPLRCFSHRNRSLWAAWNPGCCVAFRATAEDGGAFVVLFLEQMLCYKLTCNSGIWRGVQLMEGLSWCFNSVLWQETGSCVLCPYRSLFTLYFLAPQHIFIINIATAVHRSTVMTQEEKESIVHFIFSCALLVPLLIL